MGARGKKYGRPSGEGKILVFRLFAEMCIGSRSARGTAIFAKPLPGIISGSRGLVFPRIGGLREESSSICRLRVNRSSDSSPSRTPAAILYLYYETTIINSFALSY